jgi:hypothetical protein
MHVLLSACTALHVAVRQVLALWPEWQAELPEALQPAAATAATAGTTASGAAASTDAGAGSQAEAAPLADDEDLAPATKRQKTAP